MPRGRVRRVWDRIAGVLGLAGWMFHRHRWQAEGARYLGPCGLQQGRVLLGAGNDYCTTRIAETCALCGSFRNVYEVRRLIGGAYMGEVHLRTTRAPMGRPTECL